MSRIKSYTLLAVILLAAFCGIVGGGYFYFYQEAQNDSRSEGFRQQINALSAKLDAATREIAQLRTQLAAEKTPTSTDPAPAQDQDLSGNTGVLSMADMMKNMLKDNAAATENGSDSKVPMDGILDMAKQFADSPAFSKMMVTQQYSGLFERLNLTQEREDALMAVLLENSKATMSSAFDIMEEGGLKDFDPDGNAFKDMEKELRNQVAGVLKADEMTIYDDYEENKYSYLQKDQMMNELRYISDQISEPSMMRFVDVYLQNEEAMHESFDPAMPFDPAMLGGDIFNQRVETMQQTLDQLSTELAPEELAALTRHVELQRMQAAQMQSMMENMGMGDFTQELMQEMGVPTEVAAGKE